ncbi:hypothetical protein BT63DRAFT_420062 [Microthyrium microscopicum]|uniref:Uncharacterized protein n=1 Tax=Microthyrium microscopicum TaxID=703497 RepID=A0A6A6UTM1_9PEZI|nr:hypothetical protein BT63DRAFT_420062 [Microthyrium microscopicum]
MGCSCTDFSKAHNTRPIRALAFYLLGLNLLAFGLLSFNLGSAYIAQVKAGAATIWAKDTATAAVAIFWSIVVVIVLFYVEYKKKV